MRQLLIASTNEGKVREIKEFLQTLPFEILSLSDLSQKIPAPEEPYEQIELNALVKAKYYGEKAGLLTLADDAGLFIGALNGWPGSKCARIGNSNQERRQVILEKLKNEKNRKVSFADALAIFDPQDKSYFVTTGQTDGLITEKEVATQSDFGFDPILFVPEKGKTYAEMTVAEKNEISHRGKALNKIHYYLKKQYGARHIVVPCAFIIQNGKLYLQKRNDPFRPDYHGKWEFPGGGVELGETMKENIKREVKEETGFEIKVVRLLQHIQIEAQEFDNFSYQVYLLPYVCEIIGGEFVPRDHEVIGGQWFDLSEVPGLALVGNDQEFYTKVFEELKETVQKENLL